MNPTGVGGFIIDIEKSYHLPNQKLDKGHRGGKAGSLKLRDICVDKVFFKCDGDFYYSLKYEDKKNQIKVIQPFCYTKGLVKFPINEKVPSCQLKDEFVLDLSGVKGRKLFEKLKEGEELSQVPDAVLKRSVDLFLELHKSGRSKRNCFLSADMTMRVPKIWRICLTEKGDFKSIQALQSFTAHGSGFRCEHDKSLTNYSCMRYFGNKKNSCLIAGGPYQTMEARKTGTKRTVVKLRGLGTSNDNAESRHIVLQSAVDYYGEDLVGRFDPRKLSKGSFLISTKSGLDYKCLSRSEELGTTAFYVYPEKKDLFELAQGDPSNYWDEDCEKELRREFGKVGWFDDEEEEIKRISPLRNPGQQGVSGNEQRLD